MGFFDSLSELFEAATPWSTVEAEAVQRGGAGSEKTPADKDQSAGEGEAKDPEGATPDKRDVSSQDKVEGKAASGVDSDKTSKTKDDGKEEGGEEKDDEGDEKEGEGGAEEEEEEEEMVDPKEKFEEECKESKGCAPVKHHYEECVERVTNAAEETDKKHPHEDCVEEFFHLAHCATQCAAPKLWSVLK